MVLDVDLIAFEGVQWSYDKNTSDVWHCFKYFHCEQMKEPALTIKWAHNLITFYRPPDTRQCCLLGPSLIFCDWRESMPCIPEKAFLNIWGRTENFEGIVVSRWGGYDGAHVCVPVLVDHVPSFLARLSWTWTEVSHSKWPQACLVFLTTKHVSEKAYHKFNPILIIYLQASFIFNQKGDVSLALQNINILFLLTMTHDDNSPTTNHLFLPARDVELKPLSGLCSNANLLPSLTIVVFGCMFLPMLATHFCQLTAQRHSSNRYYMLFSVCSFEDFLQVYF